MAFYDKTLGRLRIVVNENGAKDHSYGHGAGVVCRDGWNDSCAMVTHTMSIEELRDLRYLLDRAIVLAEQYRAGGAGQGVSMGSGARPDERS